MDLFGSFVEEYEREFDYYAAAARMVQQQIETALRTSGIRAIVSSRAKRPDRLLEKIRRRSEERKYANGADIRSDLPDLAGVRVALYFPGDRDQVNQIVGARFVTLKPAKDFPEASASKQRSNEYKRRFPGYAATHHRITLSESTLLEAEKRYASAPVEVQVASVLMHAWAEVEHDLVYKPFQGLLSEDEYAILDELNGLVLAGEISLERLQRAGERRVRERHAPFNSQYELAAHVFNHVRGTFQKEAGTTAIGRMDVLLELLRKLRLDTATGLAPYLQDLDADFEKRPLADQLAEKIIAGDEERHKTYNNLRAAMGAQKEPAHSTAQESSARSDAFEYFLSRWSLLETVLRASTTSKEGPNKPLGVVGSLAQFAKSVHLSDEDVQGLLNARLFRNEVVHGLRPVDETFARQAGATIEHVFALAADAEDGAVRALAAAALRRLKVGP